MSSESLNFSNALNTEKQMYFYPKMASRLEQILRLKAFGCLLFVPTYFFLSDAWLPHGQLLAVLEQTISLPNVNLCILVFSFWPRLGMGGVGSLHLTECPVSFHHNAITHQIAENTLPRLKPSCFKI